MDLQNQPSPTSIGNEAFWSKHYEQQQSSGLSRIDYCRQHGLNYDRFGYWINKQKPHCKNKLISVRLKSEPVFTSQKSLCTLDLKSGYSLKIYDTKTLSLILEKFL